MDTKNYFLYLVMGEYFLALLTKKDIIAKTISTALLIGQGDKTYIHVNAAANLHFQNNIHVIITSCIHITHPQYTLIYT